MRLARNKKAPTLVILNTPAAGPGFDFPADVILAITGRVPAALAPHVSAFDGPVLDRKVLRIDSREFEQHTAAEARRQSRPAPAPDENWTMSKVVAELFGGDAAAFDAAIQLGFPNRSGAYVNGAKTESFWRARAIHEWANRVLTTAAVMAKARR
jgi:hypothetical protein